MKVDGNSPTFVGTKPDDSGWHGTFSKIPIRLEIASRLLASSISNPNNRFDSKAEGEYAANQVLTFADILIAEHNKTCEGKNAGKS